MSSRSGARRTEHRSAWVEACLAESCAVAASVMSWEQIYRALPTADDRVAPLRAYLEAKSHSLRRAFSLNA